MLERQNKEEVESWFWKDKLVYLFDLKKLSPPTAKSWAGGGSYSKWEERAFELSGESTVSVMTT